MTPVLKESDCSQDFNLPHRRKMASFGEQVLILVTCAGFPLWSSTYSNLAPSANAWPTVLPNWM